jgi:chemotaxis protein MotB
MSSVRSRSRRRQHTEEHEEGGERWLLTYADMITLLMALFMVLFSISSLNISKYRTLQAALKAAFSGQILPGGKALEKKGASETQSQAPTTTAPTTIMPYGLETSSQASGLKELSRIPGQAQVAAQQEQSSFQRLEHEIRAYASAHGLSNQVHTTVETRGLVVVLLTDKLLFASGQANLTPDAYPLLETIAGLLNVDQAHPIAVEGNTDSVPISTAEFPSNWELSTARASSIVRFLIAQGVGSHRISAVGYAEQRPTATNATEGGRRQNRRVEIVLERLNRQPQGEG